VLHTTQLAIDPRWYITDLSTKINSIGETTLDFDLHADTCVLGRDALIFLDYGRPVVVKGYDPSLGTKTYTTVSRGLAYDDPTTGKVYHLVIIIISFALCNIKLMMGLLTTRLNF
jgi:hypothetical protein